MQLGPMGGTGPYWEDWPILTCRLPMGTYRALLLIIGCNWANHPHRAPYAQLAPVGPDLGLNKLATFLCEFLMPSFSINAALSSDPCISNSVSSVNHQFG